MLKVGTLIGDSCLGQLVWCKDWQPVGDVLHSSNDRNEVLHWLCCDNIIIATASGMYAHTTTTTPTTTTSNNNYYNNTRIYKVL